MKSQKQLSLAFLLLGLFILLMVTSAFAQKSSKGILFDHPSGFYQNPFILTLSAENTSADLFYTIDGTNPLTSSSRMKNQGFASVYIDPEVDSIRPVTPAFLVRAIAMIGDSSITEHVSATFIFLNRLKHQSYPGGDWPFNDINGQHIDLEMDKKVVESTQYAELIENALLDIPSISIVTDNDNLFGRTSGIYVNALNHGKAWERPCSIELIDPKGEGGFYENAGMRIRGGYSRHPNFPKHAFRMFFREEYGTDKLRYALFEDKGVKEFDKIDLRCAQNYAWSNSNGKHNTFVREVFARDSQGEMGHPYTRSRYYHLYLNGMYWGIFQTQERSEARFAESYLGGERENYDVIKVNSDVFQYELEATDGNLDLWKKVWDMCERGFTTNTNYFLLEGKNSVGNPAPGNPVLVDIDNLIDYMLIVFYTGSFDAPISQFLQNDRPNNFYAINDREDMSTGFQFFVHDMEHSMMIDPVTVGLGISENRVNIASASGERRMEINSFKYFNPQWLHHRLSENAEYRMRFADRASRHLTNGGVFTKDKALDRFDKRVVQIDKAIIAESARWGDTRRSTPYTKDNAWLPELDELRNIFFPNRPKIVIEQLKSSKLYPNLTAPVLRVADTLFNREIFQLEGSINATLEHSNNFGEIYYTLDGQDPRLVGGLLNKEAKRAEDDKSITFNGPALLKTRVKKDGEWSALRILKLVSQDQDLTNLKLTEIQYHPEDQLNGNDTIFSKDLEFLEFKNIGETALNLSGIKVDSAIRYIFPENTLLPPQQYYVIASNSSKFYERYGMHASGNFQGNLSNGGEQIVVLDASDFELINFSYDDKNPWPDQADGKGPSIVSVHAEPSSYPGNISYWRASIFSGGSPFRDDIAITSLKDESKEKRLEKRIDIYPNPSKGFINISVYSIPDNALVDVQLINLQGQILIEQEIKNHGAFNLASYRIPRGVLILKTHYQGAFKATTIIIE